MNNPLEQIQGYLLALKADLVERRLIPVVVALVVAAVGIPVAFAVTAKKAPDVSTTPAVAQVTGPGAALAATPPRQQQTSGSLGKMHDPFAGGATSTPAGATGATGPITARTPTPTTSTGKPTVSAPLPGPSGPSGGSTGKQNPQAPAIEARALRVYHVSYSFGNGTNVKTYSDALRLDAVPSNTAPVAQWLGVTKDTRKAAFLLWNAASATGDGICISGQTPCQIIELKPGQTEFIDVIVPGAGVVQFELDMLSIHRTHAASAAEALKAHTRQSSQGIKLLSQATASALARFEYSTVFGTLLPRTTQTGTSGTTGPTGAAASNSQARPSADLGSHAVHRGHGAS